MKKPNIKALFVRVFFPAALLLLVFVSCNQDSIFADIGVEPDRVEALIGGSPTNIVVYNGAIYVTSQNATTIHHYKDDAWSSISVPENRKISGLAASGGSPDYLYALVYDKNMMDASLVSYDGINWTAIGKDDEIKDSLQVIYGAGGKLFVGGRNGETWSVYYVDDTDPNKPTLKKIESINGMLTGVAYDVVSGNFFVATTSGIYLVAAPTMTAAGMNPVPGSSGNVTGILNMNGTITAVTHAGSVITFDGTKFKSISTISDYNFTGAMAIWQNPEKPDDWLLLLGVKGNRTYNKGYRELALAPDGKPLSTENQEAAVPGSARSTITADNKSKYEASLARYSVYCLHQVSGSPVIFASTALNGLYALRNGQWNAEEE